MPNSPNPGPLTPAPASAPAPSLAFELLDSHPEGVVYFDPQFRILYANPIARRISRILPEHIGTFTHWELFPQTLGTEVETVYRRVLATRVAETIPDFLYAPFNTWYRVRAVPVDDGYAIYYQDVTVEHHHAAQQKAAEERLTFTLDAVNGVGSWEWDIVNDLVFSEPKFAAIYGVSPEEAAAGTPLANFTRNIHPEDAATTGERIADALLTGGDFVAEYRLLQADGTIRWVSTRGRVILDSKGQPLRFPGVAVDITEQKERDELLRRNEQRLSLALRANNGVGSYDWDVVNDLVYADANFAGIYGVPAEHFERGISRDEFAHSIHPDDRKSMDQAVGKVLETGGEFGTEYRVLQPDGAPPRWVAVRGRVELDSSRKPLRFSGVVVDITETKQREEQLRLSEERYRILTELSPQSQWSANPQGLVLYANRTFLDYIGHDHLPQTGEEYIECFAPEDRARVTEVWGRAVATGREYAIDARLLRGSDGASRWWHLAALPVRNEEGEIQQWLGTGTDIHDARLAAEHMQEQFAEIDDRRRELEAIYAGSPIGMALYEPTELRLTHINDRQAEIFGVNKEEALGKTFPELTHGVTASLALIQRAAEGESILGREVSGTLTVHPGEVRSWNLNYTPIFNDDGSVRAVAAATVETTAQKQAERALVQAEKLAAVGRLASSIAHEINNPLEAVTNLIFLARSHAVLPDVQQFLDLAEQELRRVSVIANQTLRFHKQTTRPTECLASDLFDSTLSLYEGRVRNSNVRVERLFRDHAPFHCFEGDIRQVISNLVGNAIDALPHSGRLLLRSRESTDWPTGTRGITLTIADTGTGIPREALQRIFEPFYTTKGFNGTGLGLWVSQDIVTRHHGKLRVRTSQSPAHRGTVFTLFLPLDPHVEDAETSIGQLANTPTQGRPN